MIGRLVLSDRNIYKIKYDNKQVSARKCYILSETSNDILIKSNKDFNCKDEYVKINPLTNTILEGLGNIGNSKSDIDIYFHIFTLGWTSKSKYNELWEKINTSFDLATNRINYDDEVITIDPTGSIDLDDGFSFSFDDEFYYLTIHIADPVSLFDFNNPIFINIIKELFLRLQTCYIGTNPTHLMPEKIIKQISLLELDSENNSRRAISFNFKIPINDLDTGIEFKYNFTNLTNITNYTYENYDKKINLDDNLKINLVKITNKLIKLMDIKLDLIEIETDISHKMIEVFMIFTNWYGGNYLINNNWKTIIRTQDSTIFGEDFDINIVPTYTRPILSQAANYKSYLKLDAKDKNDNNFHHTLGIYNYAHLTSPMRRIIDIINHLGFYQINIENIIPDFNQIFNLDKINDKIKNYKKISNAYDLVKFLKINSNSNNKENIFKACLFDWQKLENSNKIKCMMILFHPKYQFTKIVNVELPQIDLTQDLKRFMEFDIELYYNSNNFKSNKFPFSIKII